MFGQLSMVDVATRAATLTADDTLLATSKRIQKLTPSGASRNVTLPPEAGNAGLHFVFVNPSGTQNLVVLNDAGGTVATVLPGMTGVVFCDELEAWDVLFNSGTYSAVTLTAPTINGLTAASGNFDFSGSSGSFTTSTGANTLSGATTIADATTPSLTTASGKTNTGYVQVNGKTSGAVKLTGDDAMAFTLTLYAAAQSAAARLTMPDLGGSNDTIAVIGMAQTFTNKTLTSPVIATGLTASGTATNDFSGSSGAFKTSTGANTLGGATTIADATTPSLTCAAGKTNTGFVSVLGKTSGGLKFLPADATAYLVTVTTAAQSTGVCTLTIPDFNNVNDTFAFVTLAQTLANKTLTAPVIQVIAATGTTGNQYLSLTDNLADAWSIKEGANSYMTVVTTNAGEKIVFSKALDFATTVTFTGATGVNKILVQDNLAEALIVGEGANAYITVCTTNGSELITVAKATTFSGAVVHSSTVATTGATTLKAGAATPAVALRFGASATEGLEIKVYDETIQLTNAVSTNTTLAVPSGAVILSVQANLEAIITGDASGDDAFAKVGIGITGNEDKYGVTSALTKNLKVDTIPDWAVSAGETLAIYALKVDGTTPATEKFTGGAGQNVRVRVVYAVCNSLDDAA